MARRTNTPDVAELDLGWNLSVLFHNYLKRANEAFADLPGGPRAYQLLASAEREPTKSQLDHARRLGIDRTMMTYLIDDLVAAGLVERHTDSADRRARIIVATPKGRRLLPTLDRRVAQIEDDLLAALAPADAQRLRQLVRAAAASLEPSDDPRDITREINEPHRTARRSRG